MTRAELTRAHHVPCLRLYRLVLGFSTQGEKIHRSVSRVDHSRMFQAVDCHRLCLPGEPTNAAPGSEEKIQVLMARAARREPLFHPNDGLQLGTFRPDPPAPSPRTT